METRKKKENTRRKGEYEGERDCILCDYASSPYLVKRKIFAKYLPKISDEAAFTLQVILRNWNLMS